MSIKCIDVVKGQRDQVVMVARNAVDNLHESYGLVLDSVGTILEGAEDDRPLKPEDMRAFHKHWRLMINDLALLHMLMSQQCTLRGVIESTKRMEANT